jgi:Flp pilus assembly protein protease CpaA
MIDLLSDSTFWICFAIGLLIVGMLIVIAANWLIDAYIAVRDLRHRRIANRLAAQYRPGAFTAHRDYK